jgi:hypothetical protein
MVGKMQNIGQVTLDPEYQGNNVDLKFFSSSASFEWKNEFGVSKYSTCNILNTLPFYTCFNQGIGKFYFKKGKKLTNQLYSQLSLQDVQLSHPQCIESGDRNIRHSISYEKAYYGSSSLEVEGDVSGSGFSVLKLFSVDFEIKKETYFEDCIFMSKELMECYFILKLKDGSSFKTKKCQYFNDWSIQRTDLGSPLEGKQVKEILLFVQSNSSVKLNIGYLKINNSFGMKSPEIKDVNCYSSWNPNSIEIGKSLKLLNISWSPDDLTEYCEIYLNCVFVDRSYGSGVYQTSGQDKLEEGKEYLVDILPISSSGIEGKILNFKIKI